MLKHNDLIQLVAVQYRLDTEVFANSQKFATKIESLMVKIRNLIDDKYQTLVVFPEDIGTMLKEWGTRNPSDCVINSKK